MPPPITALAIAIARNAPRSLGMLEQVMSDVPLFSGFDVRTTPGMRFRTLALVSLPNVSEFTTLGAGFRSGQSGYEMREFSCAYMGALVEVPVDVANVFAEENPDIGYDYFTMEAGNRLKADLILAEKTVIYGTAIDPKGYPGLRELTPGTIATNVLSMSDTPDDYDFQRSVLDAGGTTTGSMSSAFSIRFGLQGCQIVLGGTSGNSELFSFTERQQQFDAPDPVNAPERKLLMERAQYSGHIGLSVAGTAPVKAGEAVPSQFCLRRLKHLTNETGCGMDDEKVENLVNSHPDGHTPDVLVMSPRSGKQWANSRKSTGGTVFVGGQGSGRDGTIIRQPKRPTDWEGIPVIYSRSVKNNEAIEVAA